MTPGDQARLLSQLQADEGLRNSAYQDSLGWWTIGYGRLIDARKGGHISTDEALYLLQNDVAAKEQELSAFAWFNDQDSVRQAALTNMAFNLGTAGLLQFPHFLGCMLNKDYPGAVANVINTPWHTQVGVRADRIIKLIETGAWT